MSDNGQSYSGQSYSVANVLMSLAVHASEPLIRHQPDSTIGASVRSAAAAGQQLGRGVVEPGRKRLARGHPGFPVARPPFAPDSEHFPSAPIFGEKKFDTAEGAGV